jgi:hypothetical protein
MTTSNSTVWELTRDQIITAALRKIGVLNKGATPDATDLADGTIALNGIIARFNTLGMPLWKRTEVGITLVAGTATYTLNNAIKVPEVYVRATSGSTQYKLETKSEYDLQNLPYSSTGVPVSWSFTPNLAEGGTLRIWPIPDSGAASNYSLRVIYQDELDTFTASGETPDFPAYWTDALVYALAVALAPEKGVPLNDRKALREEAMQYLAQAQSYGDEDGSIFLQPYPRS